MLELPSNEGTQALVMRAIQDEGGGRMKGVELGRGMALDVSLGHQYTKWGCKDVEKKGTLSYQC